MSMSFGRTVFGAMAALLAGGPIQVAGVSRRAGILRPTLSDALTYMPPSRALGKGKGKRARGSRMKVSATMRAQHGLFRLHKGKREIARRKVQMLRIELNRCCKQMAGMPYDAQIDYGYVDGAQDLDDQILELMPLAYGRKTHNAPRRVWRIECFNSSQHRASSRAPLKRNFYVRYFDYPIVLQEGGAA